MTARRADIADLPDWPRGLSLAEAARYVGVSPETFRRHVPVAPRKLGGRLVWDRKLLDDWFDSERKQGEHAVLSPSFEDAAARWGRSR